MRRFSTLPSRLLSAVLLVSSFLMFTQPEAHAYLDAGTGSMLIQVLMGSALAGLFTLKIFWRKLTLAFRQHVLRQNMEPAHDDVDVRN